MKRVLILAVLVAVPAFAQQQPSPAMVQGFVAELEVQRNAAGTRAAQLAGQLTDEQEKSKARDAEIADLKKKCGDPCKPKEASKK